MKHYNTNIENIKFKNKISIFLSRISFWLGKLPLAWRAIIFVVLFIFILLFFPWVAEVDINNNLTNHLAFSKYTGFIGYGVWLGGIIILFFLLSHNKKEQIRGYVPFRLSDVQAIVFVVSMILSNIFMLFALSPIISREIIFTKYFSIAITGLIFILYFSFHLSKQLKAKNTESYYLDHEWEIIPNEYDKILHPEKYQNHQDKQNMKLPI